LSDSGTPSTTFEQLNLSEAARAAVEALGWIHPTPIQAKAIPPALEGKDVVGIAQTGTGKTGAFMLPTLERIKAGGGLQALILAPTRELAQQVAEDTEFMAKGTAIRVAAIYGGVKYGPQLEALEQGYEVIAATPGRFIDHMRQGKADLSNVRYFILDEADRMLDMGFRPQIEDVMRGMHGERQTMLFSATMPHGVHDLALRLTKDAVWVEAAPSGTTASGIEEVVYSVKPEKKPELLLHLLEQSGWDQVLIFSRTKAGADVLESHLEREGISAAVMHSDRGMKERTRSLDDFARGQARVLVATDIAQRGLDVEGISHVVNYDVPLDPEDYVHRIGRTGRAGASGMAITFVTAGDLGHLKSLENHLGRKLPREHLPDYDYAGAPQTDTAASGRRGRKSRSPKGMGSKLGKELSPDELADLLSFDD
jgi:ATP-dependent RNA helicase RhlE